MNWTHIKETKRISIPFLEKKDFKETLRIYSISIKFWNYWSEIQFPTEVLKL